MEEKGRTLKNEKERRTRRQRRKHARVAHRVSRSSLAEARGRVQGGACRAAHLVVRAGDALVEGGCPGRCGRAPVVGTAGAGEGAHVAPVGAQGTGCGKQLLLAESCIVDRWL